MDFGEVLSFFSDSDKSQLYHKITTDAIENSKGKLTKGVSIQFLVDHTDVFQSS